MKRMRNRGGGGGGRGLSPPPPAARPRCRVRVSKKACFPRPPRAVPSGYHTAYGRLRLNEGTLQVGGYWIDTCLGELRYRSRNNREEINALS